MPSSVGPVDVGDIVVDISCGYHHTCVLTGQQTVRCWGYNFDFQLGNANMITIGDDELPSSIGPVDVGDDALQVSAGIRMTCARLVGGVRCWGRNFEGQLGQSSNDQFINWDPPSAFPFVSLGNLPLVDIVTNGRNTCVRYDDSTIRCWGYNNAGELGLGNTITIGDDEVPSDAPLVDVGGDVDEIWFGNFGPCVRSGGDVKCWGNEVSVNGQGQPLFLGDNEVPSSFPMIDLGFAATDLAEGTSGYHVCALSGTDLRCWGRNSFGQLGYGNQEAIGDNEVPSSVGLVSY